MNRKLFVCSVWPFGLWNNNQTLMENASTKYQRENNLEGGKERLFRMFSLDASGSFSPELTVVYQSAIFGAVVGGAYGGFKSSKLSPEEIERNKAITLTMKFDERSNLAQKAGRTFASNFFKGAYQWGWRVGLLCGSMALITTVTSTYRGYSGVLEYTLSGSIIGTLASWTGGVKGMAVRGLLGSALGSIFGCAAYSFTSVSGTTTEEAHFWRYGWEEAQLKPSKEKVWKLREESRLCIESEMGERNVLNSANESNDQ